MEICHKAADFITDLSGIRLCKGINEMNNGDYKRALEFFDQACERDHEDALIFAGILHYTGFVNVVKNQPKAMELFKKAADSPFNNCVAQYMLGMAYLDGNEAVKKDVNTSLYWFSQSANNGWTLSQARLGFMYQVRSMNFKTDTDKSIHWYKKVLRKQNYRPAIEDGLKGTANEYKLFGIGKYKMNFKKIDKVIVMFTKRAVKSKLLNINRLVKSELELNCDTRMEPFGEGVNELHFWIAMSNPSVNVPICQFNLGLLYNGQSLYHIGASLEENLLKNANAYKYVLKAAKNGHYSAQYVMAYNYELGSGEVVQQDYSKAVKWYTTDISHTCPEPSYRMGCLYYRGVAGVVEKCLKKALSSFQFSAPIAEQYGDSFYMTGLIYDHGSTKDGIKQDIRKAITNYKLAASYGSKMGAAGMGSVYLWGRSPTTIDVDYRKAAEWFAKATTLYDRKTLDCPSIYFYLGFMHLHGLHFVASVDQALIYFNKALEKGYEFAKFGIDIIEMIDLMKAYQICITKSDYEEYNNIVNDVAATVAQH